MEAVRVAAPKKKALNGHLVFIDESGFCESGVIRQTWAPRGQTPVVHTKGRSWKRMSTIGALAYPTDGSDARLFLSLKRGPVLAQDFTKFLQHLGRHLCGRVIVIWDRLHGHRSVLVKEWAKRQRRFELHYLPAYALELNPVEALWSWVKGTCLANCSHDELEPLADEVRRGARRARRRRALLDGFRRKAGLYFGRM